tara:strand:- start:385 stop:609 length:225 start_codon:yes stop_codon:yes gene_type:complete
LERGPETLDDEHENSKEEAIEEKQGRYAQPQQRVGSHVYSRKPIVRLFALKRKKPAGERQQEEQMLLGEKKMQL